MKCSKISISELKQFHFSTLLLEKKNETKLFKKYLAKPDTDNEIQN